MKPTAKEEQRALRFLQRNQLTPEQIAGFSFMQRHTPEPERHSPANVYGPGILTLRLKSGEEKIRIVHLHNHPTALIRTLVSRGSAFDNLPAATEGSPRPTGTTVYRRMSLYMFWYFVLFILCLSLAFHTLNIERWTGIVLPILFFSASLYSIYLLQVRFCYLRLEADRLTVVSAGREIHYAYDNLLKVNFDFAREPNATHVMEILDKTYRYRLYYIGRVPRTQLNEIAERLRQAGIDATCSLNDEKRHYHDVYHG